MTVEPREQLPAIRGRQPPMASNVAARTVVARKGILTTTIADIAAGAAIDIYYQGTNHY